MEGYSHRSQFISESYALGSPNGPALRFLGYLPSGLSIAVFAWTAARVFRTQGAAKWGFFGLGVFYGLGTAVTALFPCEAGCETPPGVASLTQDVHNISGLMTYIFVPFALLLIGSGLRKSRSYTATGTLALICGATALAAVVAFFASVDTDHRGSVQRVVEASVLLWILVCAWTLRHGPKHADA